MNKFFIFFAFASFALVGCSDNNKEPKRGDLCAAITKECLAGIWLLQTVEGGLGECNPTDRGDLELLKSGRFIFNGAYGGYPSEEKRGTWELLPGEKMKISFDGGGDPSIKDVTATFKIRDSGYKLEITTKGYTGFLQCRAGTDNTEYTEKFSFQN